MNRARARELLPIIQAFSEGKEIQGKHKVTNKWVSLERDGQMYWDWDTDIEWRVAPAEPREFWLFMPNMRAYYERQIGPNPEEDNEYIKVREVLE